MSSNKKPAQKTPARPAIKAVRGTRDLLPDQTPLWNRVETTARAVFARYGFGEIRTPIFEATELFARGVGEETDIVGKEMFTWDDGERFVESRLLETWRKKYDGSPDVTIGIPLFVSSQKHARHQTLIAEYKNEGVTEIVEFKQKVTDEACKSLWESRRQIVGSDTDPYKGNPVRLRLVVPDSGKNAIRAFDPDVIVEPLSGNFFESTQSLTLRPESTAGVVRAYIEHRLGETGQLQKLFYIGPQFRRERPQRGRYRQFWQIGAEVIGPQTSGAESPIRDAEVLEMLASLLDELGVRDWKLELNSVGSSDDRARYNIALREALEPVKAQLCPDNQRRAETNPLRVLDSKDEADQDIIDALPKIADYLGPDSRDHFAQVLAALEACSVAYTVNPRLVRGLDYYTRTTFEFTVTTGLGTQNALLGGGRYDGLSEMLGGPRAPGIGFAIGEDRLILTLQAQHRADLEASLAADHAAAEAAQSSGGPFIARSLRDEWGTTKLDAYIAPIGFAQNAAALALARDLRREGLTIEVGDGKFKLGKSFDTADKLARHIILLGEDEAATNILTVKTFVTGEQVKVDRNLLAEKLRS
jgi:histidyl-tRNA synthetase